MIPRIDAHRKVLRSIPLRISVCGVRGKSTVVRILEEALRQRHLSTIAKVTGTDPYLIDDGRKIAIHRDGPVMLDETIGHLSKYSDKNVAILENNAIGPYTMRIFHEELLDPHLVLVPSIRRDHLDRLPRRRRHIARIFGSNIRPGRTMLVAEPDHGLAQACIDAARKVGAEAHRVEVPPGPPGIANLALVDATLRHLGLPPLSEDQRRAIATRIAQAAMPTEVDFRFLDASAVNDVDSTERLIDHAFEGPFHLVLSLRDDRPARTAEFQRFAMRLHREGRLSGLWVAGPCPRRLRGIGAERVEDDAHGARRVIESVAGQVILAANHNTDFSRSLISQVEQRRMQLAGDIPGPVLAPILA